MRKVLQSWSRGELIAVAIVVGFHLFSLISAILRHSWLADDSIQYYTLAENFAQQGTFSQSFHAPFVPDLQRTPGYPIFLWILKNPILVLILQHILVLGTGYFLFRLLRSWFSEKAARISTFFWLLQPYSILLSSFILSETLFLFLFVAGISLWVEGIRNGKITFESTGFFLLILSIYVRPLGLAILPVWIVYVGIRFLKDKTVLMSLVRTLRLVFMVVLLLLPWYLRNHQINGKWMFSTMGETAMLYGRAAGIQVIAQGVSPTDDQLFRLGDSLLVQGQNFDSFKTYPEGFQTQETERLVGPVTQITLNQLVQNPGAAIQMFGGSVVQMLQGVGFGWAKENMGSQPAYLAAGIQTMANVGMYIAFLWGLFRIKKWNSAEWIAFLGILLVFAASTAIWADGRYRIPADLLMMVFVAGGLDRLLKKIGRNNRLECEN